MRSYSGLALSGEALSKKCRESLSSLGFTVMILPEYERLGEAVSSHADLLLLPIENKIFTFSEYAERIRKPLNRLEDMGYSVEELDMFPSASYPNDVALNCLTVGKKIFSKAAHTSSKAKSFAKSQGYELIDVNQGYARCTACHVSDNALISADPSILKAAERNGIRTLKIREGHVSLKGYEYGFIGGACGVFENGIFFAGDLSQHPDGEKIAEFCALCGKTAISLSDEPLCDVGSIFFF